jgi:glycosyltransferase involved in cell wall biosynthesis
MSSKKNLIILSGLPLTNIGPSYSRMVEYSKAFANRIDIDVYLLSTLLPMNLKEFINIENFSNIYRVGEKKKYDKLSQIWLFSFFLGFRNVQRYMKSFDVFISKLQGEVVILIYPSFNSLLEELYVIWKIRKKKIKIFSERNERKLGIAINRTFPANFLKRIIFIFIYAFIIVDNWLQDFLVYFYNGNIVISTRMEEWVQRLNKNVIRIPILVDVNKFNHCLKQPIRKEIVKIGYTGSITLKKDGIGYLIKSLSILINKYRIENVQLNIYGFGYRGVINKIKKMIEERGLCKNVYIHEPVLAEEIPMLLSKHDILIMIRPKNLQTNYGLSTKLAEYMASGKIILTSNVSDNNLYIVDGENGFIINTTAPEFIAQKLVQIINSGIFNDIEMAEHAYRTALSSFNIKNYRDILEKFLFN